MNARKGTTKEIVLNIREQFQSNQIDVETATKNMVKGLEINTVPVNVWQIDLWFLKKR